MDSITLPRSLKEADSRINNLKILHQQTQQDLNCPNRGRELAAIARELQVLKQWRKSAHIQIQLKMSASGIVNASELKTESGLIRHLYLMLARLARDGAVLTEDDKVVLDSARYWLREHLSSALPPVHHVQFASNSKKEEWREWGHEDPVEQTRMAMRLISRAG